MKNKFPIASFAHLSALSLSMLVVGMCTHLLSKSGINESNSNLQNRFEKAAKVVKPSVSSTRDFDFYISTEFPYANKQLNYESSKFISDRAFGDAGYAGKASKQGHSLPKPYRHYNQNLDSTTSQDKSECKSTSKLSKQEHLKHSDILCYKTLIYRAEK